MAEGHNLIFLVAGYAIHTAVCIMGRNHKAYPISIANANDLGRNFP